MKNAACGAWVAQSVKLPTLDFDSGHDLMVHEIESRVRLHADSTEAAWDSLPFSLSLSWLVLSLSKYINTLKNFFLKNANCHLRFQQMVITDLRLS